MKINGKCNVCLTVMEIYGTVESVVPWLCECGKTALMIVCSKMSKPEQRMTTILVCHLRWKGEEDWNPGRVSR